MSEDYCAIVGLGNPGTKYDGTRHNVGFYVIDEMANRFGVKFSLQRWEARYVLLNRWGHRLCLIKPQTYMNLSGKSVARFAQFFKIPVQKILVLHDDIDMNCGRLKIVCGRGAGGHNGIRSLIECLGSKEFYRVKFGVGRPGQQEGRNQVPVEKFVLSVFPDDERKIVDERINVIEQGIKMIVQGNISEAKKIINSVR